MSKHYARVGSLPRSGDFRLYAEITMTDPDKMRLTEVELELRQRDRLMEAFRLVQTYDDRESVIAFCEEIIGGGNEKHG